MKRLKALDTIAGVLVAAFALGHGMSLTAASEDGNRRVISLDGTWQLAEGKMDDHTVPAPPAPKWLAEVTRVAYTDNDNRVARNDWPDNLLRSLAEAKAQLFFSRAHSGEGWEGLAWRGAYGEPDPAMGDRDGTRHVTELCHKLGMRYIAYYWAQREPLSIAKAHPEWRCLNSHGKPTGYYCVNNPAYRELVRNRVVELVRKVGVDGIFFDMFHARADECYCPHCEAKFRKAAGEKPPVKEDFDSLLWQQWVDFKYRSIEEALLDFNRAIKAANPEAALMVNTWNAWVYRNPHNIRNSIRVAESVDGLLEETGWYDTVDPSFFAFPSHYSFMSWHLGGLARPKASLMWSSPSYLRTQPIGYTELAIRAAVMTTNGSTPAASVPSRAIMTRHLADIAARDEYIRGDAMFPWCGLVVSEKTEFWYGRDNPKDRYLKGVYGAFQTMLERHLPVSLVTDRDLELGRLPNHRVLLMPNCAALSAAEAETVRRFVRDGGGLVATYETSLYDEHGRRQADFRLADVLGAKPVGAINTEQLALGWLPSKITSTRIDFAKDHPWSDDPEILQSLGLSDAPTMSLALQCRTLLVEDAGKLRPPLRLVTAQPNVKTNQLDRGNYPGVIETSFGKGRVIYIPFDLTWMSFRYGHAHSARLLELAVRQAAADPPPIDVAAPSIVQTMVHTQDKRLVVHLVNDISSQGRSQNVAGQSLYERREVIPINDIRITIRGPKPSQVFWMPGKQALEASQVAEGMQVRLPPLEIHAMVVIER